MWKLALRHAALAATLALPFGLAFAPGCTQAQQVCDVVCECQHCSDRAQDDCLIEVDRMVEQASAWECVDEMDAYVECVLNDNECDDANFNADDCIQDELVDLFECIDDNSDIINTVDEQPPPPPGG